MTTYIALLRGVNVGGRRPVAMADLQSWMKDLGLVDGRSLIQSGNLIFRTRAQPAVRLERRLEAAASERLGLTTDFFVRTAVEWGAILEGNPFPEDAERNPSRLLVACLKDEPGEARGRLLESAIPGPERVRLLGRSLYIVYPDGIGNSRLTTALIERTLGTSNSARNWNTVRKLHALASAQA